MGRGTIEAGEVNVYSGMRTSSKVSRISRLTVLVRRLGVICIACAHVEYGN